MARVFQRKSLQNYSMCIGANQVHLVAIPTDESDKTKLRHPHGLQRTGLLIHDNTALPSLKENTKPPGQLPGIKQLSAMKNIPARSCSAYPGKICFVTSENVVMTAESKVGTVPSETLKFQAWKSDSSEVLAVSCGAEHVVWISSSSKRGYLCGIGSNLYGQLGLGSTKSVSKPEFVPIGIRFVDVCCGWMFTLLLSQTGDVCVCGQNSNGQLGIGRVCESVREVTLCESLLGVPICSLACGSCHSLVLSSTGIVYVAGSNQQGQLGIDSIKDDCPKFTILQCMVDVLVVKVAAFGCYSAAIDEYGALYLWGGKYGPRPTSFVLESREKFIDIALGSQGKGVALTRRNSLFVWGYNVNGNAVSTPAKIYVPDFPVWRICSGGEYFLVCADQKKQTPFSSVAYGTEGTLLPPAPSSIKHRLRPPKRVLSLSAAHFPALMKVGAAAAKILQIIFTSPSALNASFLLENFSESQAASSSGTDIDGLIRAFDCLLQSESLMMTVTKSLAQLLFYVRQKMKLERPVSMRFFLIAAFHPSPLVFGHGLGFWIDFVRALETMNVSRIFVQWLSVLSKAHIQRVLQSIMNLLTLLLRGNPGGLYSDAMQSTVGAIVCVQFAAVRGRILSFEEFYHEGLNSVIDVAEDHNRWSHNQWSFAGKAPCLLNADTKTQFLYEDASCLHKEAQLARVWSLVLEGQHGFEVEDMFLLFLVRREALVEDTMRIVQAHEKCKETLKKPLMVEFVGEPGVDQGGVRREYFELIMKDLFSKESGLFTDNGHFYWFNSKAKEESDLARFRLVGILFGLAVSNRVWLNVKLPNVVFKKLRRFELWIQDLEELDESLARSLVSILEYNGDVSEMYLTFEYCGVPLRPNGADIPVTNENRRWYVSEVVTYVLESSIEKQFMAFKDGFTSTAGELCLDLFRPEELALLICGREELDFYDLQAVTRYENYTKDSPTIRAFWKIVHTRLSEEEKKKLLVFVTSCPRAPINGLGGVPFVITRDPDPRHLPTSHTCFTTLVLPDDPDEESLYRKIMIAVENSEGFGFK